MRPPLVGCRWCRGPFACCWSYMNNVVASGLQRFKDYWQCFDRPFMDVVEQEHPFSTFFKTAKRTSRDFFRAYLAPVVSRKICAPHHQPSRCQVLLGRIGPAESWEPK